MTPRLGAGRPLAAVAIGLALIQLLLFWPGIASFDIVYIYAERVRHDVGDWHPPILIRLWSTLIALGLKGTGPLLLIQLGLFWLGIGLLAAACIDTGRRAAAWALLAAALLPPVSGWMIEVVKDSQMTGALVAAAGLAGHYRLRGRPMPGLAIAGVALALLYATLLRPNGLFATAPLAALLACHGRRAVACVASAVLPLLAVAIMAPLLNHQLFAARPAHAERSQQLFDMAGIADRAGLPSIPGVARDRWAEAERHACYTPFAWDSYSTRQGCTAVWAAVRDRPLARDWAAAIVQHPVAYLGHRLAHWNMSLRFLVAAGEPRGTTQKYSTPNPWRLGSDEAAAPRISYKIQKILAETPLGWPFAWFAWGLALLGVAATMPRTPHRDLAIALAASGVTQVASLFFVSVAADQRYHAWPIAAIALATALLAGDRLPRRRAGIAAAVLVLLCLCAAVARATMTANWPAGF